MAMKQQPSIQVESNFTGGLKTEFTGLNFPENACTDVSNCVFTLVGDVLRREGIDYEANFSLASVVATSKAISTFKWDNAGGDGLTQIIVVQVGNTLNFYQSSSATIAAPLSNQLLISAVNLGAFQTTASSGAECQYSTGNGYLFVYHPNCDPFYCTYAAGTVTGNLITVQIRDFVGIAEPGVADTLRPVALSAEHQYNLQNQGWISSPGFSATSTTANNTNVGTKTWTIQTGLTISIGTFLTIVGADTLNHFYSYESGTVTSYTSGSGVLIVNVTGSSQQGTPVSITNWTFSVQPVDQINTWHSAFPTSYPSNSDVWWTFKNSSNVFSPSTTIANVTVGGPAPKGSYILSAFKEQRGVASGVDGLTDVTTNSRPKTGTWFQGRVWYTGVDASFPAAGDEVFSTWSENIYFSQIAISPSQFGRCYQNNDPTDETLFNLLPTDGGVIQIQGSGSVYKLFPIQNGMLVFASNGIWFITGGSSVGFTASDYTITKISGVESISSTSFVSVNGLPMFWNEEGIYAVQSGAQDKRNNEQLGLEVIPITLGTILSFYNTIPLQSKKYARGAYNPITYTLQWIYRSTNESDVTSRYQFDSFLCFNTQNHAFYPYSITGTPQINGIAYVQGPGGSTSPDPTFKYLCSASGQFTFAEERDTTYVDWKSFDSTGVNYDSFFITGYRLTGQALMRFSPQYVFMYSRNLTNTSYKIQAIWDYASSSNSGRYSSVQLITNTISNYNKFYRKHRLRGHGVSMQIKVMSVDGHPFDIMGWAVLNDVDSGI